MKIATVLLLPVALFGACEAHSTTTTTKTKTTTTTKTVTVTSTLSPTPTLTPTSSGYPQPTFTGTPPPPGTTWTSSLANGFDANWNILYDAFQPQDRAVVPDPAGGGAMVMQVMYPAGSAHPSGSPLGGTGLYAVPIDLSAATSVTLTYQVYFPKGFNWVKGGKLPGLYGGHVSCTGGNAALDCFSTRYMFRGAGAGEIYMYVDQSIQNSGFCNVPPKTTCDTQYGDSLGQGSFYLTPGSWDTLSQTIVLNSFSGGNANEDGIVEVSFNGKQVINFNKVIYRTMPSVGHQGIVFMTFFGGSDMSWATPTLQYSYYKNFVLTINS